MRDYHKPGGARVDRERREATRRDVARRVGTWRRLVLARGPKHAIPTAMMLAELAYPDENGALLSRPTHETVAAATRDVTRTVRRACGALLKHDWLERVGPRPMTGSAQTYRLRLPSTLPPDVIAAAKNLKPGSWQLIVEPDRRTLVSGSELSTVGQNEHDRRTKSTREADTSVRPMGLDTDINSAHARDGDKGAAAHGAQNTTRMHDVDAPSTGPNLAARAVINGLRRRFGFAIPPTDGQTAAALNPHAMRVALVRRRLETIEPYSLTVVIDEFTIPADELDEILSLPWSDQ